MDNLQISTAQFENRSGDKLFNLSRIEELSEKAANGGSRVIAFHECSVTGYTFARNLSKSEMLELAEFVPDGPSTARLIQIASKSNIIVLAGLFEKDGEGRLYKTYVCVGKNGLIAKYHKLHPFINQHFTAGNSCG